MMGNRNRSVLSDSALRRSVFVAVGLVALWAAVLWAVAAP